MPAFLDVIFWMLVLLFTAQFMSAAFFTLRRFHYPGQQVKKINAASVVIPFHNEALRITALLDSLNKQTVKDKTVELIFVDDHSSDNTSKIVEATLKIPYTLVSLTQKSGKKKALHTGIEKSQHAFILTLDADVELPADYFDRLFQLPESDMIILPVRMSGKKIIQRLASIEFGWLQLLTFGSQKPTLCNGANFLFRKAIYDAVYQTRSDFDLASGDDVFLLSAFLKSNRTILRVREEKLTVKTPAPENSKQLLQQRRRWVGKLSRMQGQQNYAALIFLILIQAGFVFSAIAAFFQPVFLFLITLKIITEFLLALSARQTDTWNAFITTMIHQAWYPVYLILLLFPVDAEKRWEKH